MKLRNKKTGNIAEAIDLVAADEIWGTAKTPSEIFEGWEFYEEPEPAEPLIKDERVRKAVRAWAEAIYEDTIRFDRVSQGFSFGNGIVFSSINFDGFVFDLVDGKKYTIAELCGEEGE